MESDALARQIPAESSGVRGERGVLFTITTIMAGAVVGVIALAGILKLSDIEGFHQTLSGWTILPEPVVPLLAVVVPGVEVALAAMWLMPRSRRLAVAVSICFLVTVSGVAVIQHVLYGYVDCGCFGRRSQAESAREGLAWLLGRNIAMIGILLAAFSGRRRACP